MIRKTYTSSFQFQWWFVVEIIYWEYWVINNFTDGILASIAVPSSSLLPPFAKTKWSTHHLTNNNSCRIELMRAALISDCLRNLNVTQQSTRNTWACLSFCCQTSITRIFYFILFCLNLIFILCFYMCMSKINFKKLKNLS